MMSTATLSAGRESGDRPGGGRRTQVAVGVALAALLLMLAGWLLGWFRFTTDPRVAEILALQEEARQKYESGGGPTNLVDATAAVATMGQIRQKIEALPAHLRPAVERQGGSMFRSMYRARIDAYFNASPEKRRAELDRQIDQEEMWRKAVEAGQAVAGAFGGGAAQSGGSGQAGGVRQQGGSGQQGGGPPRSGTEEERNKWRKDMIDRTTPEERARWVEYRRAMDARREERKLQSNWSR